MASPRKLPTDAELVGRELGVSAYPEEPYAEFEDARFGGSVTSAAAGGGIDPFHSSVSPLGFFGESPDCMGRLPVVLNSQAKQMVFDFVRSGPMKHPDVRPAHGPMAPSDIVRPLCPRRAPVVHRGMC